MSAPARKRKVDGAPGVAEATPSAGTPIELARADATNADPGRVDHDDENDDDEATKVGAMSAVLIEKMMLDAENAEPALASRVTPTVKAVSYTSTKKTSRPPPNGIPDDVDLPVLSVEEDEDAQPTLLNPRARPPRSIPVPAVSAAASNVVDSVVNEVALGYAERSLRSEAITSPPLSRTSSRPSAPSVPSLGVVAPLPAVPLPAAPVPTSKPPAFPEWLGVTFRPDDRGREHSLLFAVALGAGVFVVCVAVIWGIFL